MSTVKFTEDHEWIEIDGEIGTVGITDHAQEQLGDLVFVELPAVGKQITKGKEAAVLESVKAASEVYAPADGEVTEVNEALNDDPGTVNRDAQGEGWFFKMKFSDPSQLESLMDEAAYKEFAG